MLPCQQIPETLPGLVLDSEQHEHDDSVQSADADDSMAAFAEISGMIESLDDLLAGESEVPTTKHEPYDEQFPVQSYPTPELDPATVVCIH